MKGNPMDKMADMKISDKERKEMYVGPTAPSSMQKGPKYPWGLEIRLDDEALKKLGLDELPDAGVECTLIAIGRVTETSQRENADGKKSRNVTIQIEKLSVDHDEEEEAFARGASKGRKRGY